MLLVETRLLALPIMFKGMALDYYYSHIANMSHMLSYEQVCNMVVTYFEGVEYRRITLDK